MTNGAVNVTNTILSCLPGQTNVSGAVRDGGHNICSDASANFTAATSRMNLDPALGALGNYGGLTLTIPLLPSSPALDTGDDSAAPPTDQRGVSRPKGLASDIGAFELAPQLLLRSLPEGKLRLDYAFQAGRTNLVDATTKLVDWASLGVKVADTNGVFELEQLDPALFPVRFYRVQIVP
jgi:hypothetical protein